ncbi:hypothetical protein CEXT_230771 [Caerostris extrusa]|uniref:Uncharacterized protein n=1 Tax=Caerostris extrusa TaxID=172846 RepID=A0AAV4VXV0_CAEEX|nr:hypothetical protein CEXT_230771 [Caerostris extrusa]
MIGPGIRDVPAQPVIFELTVSVPSTLRRNLRPDYADQVDDCSFGIGEFYFGGPHNNQIHWAFVQGM